MATSPLPSLPPTRLASLDAFRGITMLFMASEMLQLPQVAQLFPDSVFWRTVGFHTSHVPWSGGSVWDMIQPSFTFMVGVALPWSVANRRARGQKLGSLWLHALWRSIVLVLLGVFLRSVGRPSTNFTFEDVLSQIGLGYLALFLLGWTRPRTQALAAGLILTGYWAAFALYPAPGPGFDFARVGVPSDWPNHLQGFAAHWDKNSNLAAAFDQWFLNLFHRPQPFLFNGGGYLTLSFIPSLATMIFGLLCGELLRGERTHRDKLRWLGVAGVAGIAAGWLLDATGVCPVVKRIWTPSWTLFSAGWVCLALAGFYWVVDVRGQARWFRAFCAVGMNSIAMYVMVHLWDRFLIAAIQTHLGWNVFSLLPPPGLKFAARLCTFLLLWQVCLWMDRRKLYLRI